MLEEYLESLPPRQRHHSRRALQKEVWGPTRDIPVHLLAERAVEDMDRLYTLPNGDRVLLTLYGSYSGDMLESTYGKRVMDYVEWLIERNDK